MYAILLITSLSNIYRTFYGFLYSCSPPLSTFLCSPLIDSRYIWNEKRKMSTLSTFNLPFLFPLIFFHTYEMISPLFNIHIYKLLLFLLLPFFTPLFHFIFTLIFSLFHIYFIFLSFSFSAS